MWDLASQSFLCHRESIGSQVAVAAAALLVRSQRVEMRGAGPTDFVMLLA